MIGLYILVVLFLGLLPVHAQEGEVREQLNYNDFNFSNRLSGEWQLGMHNFWYREDVDSSSEAFPFVRSRGEYQFSDSFYFSFDLGVGFKTGRAQLRYFDPHADRTFYPGDITFNWKPNSQTYLRAGLISQVEEQGLFTFLDNYTFPGLKQNYIRSFNDFTLNASAQQVIPTSYTDNVERTEEEKLPTLYLEKIQLCYCRPVYELKGQLAHYNYNNLPAVVAHESGVRGATLTSNEFPGNAHFAYDFNGYMAGIEGLYTYGEATLLGGLHLIENLKAPEGAARGQMVYGQVDWQFNNLIVSPRLENFFSESDTAPAYYTDEKYGHTNRVGMSYKLNLRFNDLGFQASIRHTTANPITKEGTTQDNFHSTIIKLETVFIEF